MPTIKTASTTGILLFWLLSACSSGNYEAEIQEYRADQWEFFTSSQSPLPEAQRAAFEELAYFDVDTKYRINAEIERLPVGQYFSMPMTNGSVEQYTKYGYAVFSLDGEEQRLLLLKSLKERTQLFLAFTDPSNGASTYGGGRYLDIENPNTARLILDFNKAYNPYCAYNEAFVCPVPPRENHLTVPILAGEKSYK